MSLSLKQLARRRRMKEQEIARTLHLSPSTVSRWFRGHVPVPGKHMQDLAALLGVDVVDILPPPTRTVSNKRRVLDADAVRDLLRQEADQIGGIERWATIKKVRRSEVRAVLDGRLNPTRKTLDALGLQVVKGYQPTDVGDEP